MDLKRFDKIRSNCKHLIDYKTKNYYNSDYKIGLWCTKQDKKCTYQNCPHTHPLISCGTLENKEKDTFEGGNALTKKQMEAIKLRNSGLTFSEIAHQMGVSKKRAWVLVTESLKKLGGVTIFKKIKKKGGNDKLGGVTIKKHLVSLHNDSISINCQADLNLISCGELKHLKYTDYKLMKTDQVILKIFNKKLVIQFREDIIKPTIEECYKKATNRLQSYISTFNILGVTLDLENLEQLSRHYAIIGTDLAKNYIKEGKKLFIYDPWDKKERVRIDFSDKDKKGGLPHLEFTHKIKAKDDAEATKEYIESMINYPHYLPHEVKGMLDIVLHTQKEYAIHIKKHLLVQDETLKTLKKIQKSLK